MLAKAMAATVAVAVGVFLVVIALPVGVVMAFCAPRRTSRR